MRKGGKIIKYLLSAILFLSFGFLDTNNLEAATDSGTINKFFTADQAPQYISMVYTWGSLIVGGLSLIVIAYAGITYMRSMGSPEVIGQSKTMISGALIGLFLVLGGYMLLRIMDPRLVDLKLTVPGISFDEDLGAVSVCSKANGTPCVHGKSPDTTCSVVWKQCDLGSDTKHDVNLKITCDTDNKWKIKKDGVCALDPDENDSAACAQCNDNDASGNSTKMTSPVPCQSGTTCTDVGTGSNSSVGWDVCAIWPVDTQGDGRTWYCK